MCPHSKTNSESTSWVLSMSMKGLDGYFQTCNLSSAVSACLFIDLQGQVVEQRIALSTEPEPALMPIFPALASVGLRTVCSSWNLVHGSSLLLLLHVVRVGMFTSDSQCHDTAAMAGRRSRGRRREQVFFSVSLFRKAAIFVKLYLCRPKVQRVEA